jgi:phosphoglycolate phosphatase-like HAD superfamily hydrolase
VRPTVLLFDIDGTLVTTAGVGRRALEAAFAARYGTSAALRDVGFDGMTDRAIVRAGLGALGVAADEASIDALLADYVPRLEAEIAATPSFRLQRGVPAVLDAVDGRPGVALGLGTGNIRLGARAKLGALGVFDRFRFGGFGCDHESRDELLRLGAARGAALLDLAVADCRVVVIGDTPRDVAAAHAIGAQAIGIGSARYGCSDLLASGAAIAFPDLAAPGLVAALLED